MTSIIAQAYRANARQCLSWAESASDPENRDAFFALAATWEAAATGSRDRLPRRESGQPANLRSVGRPRVNDPRWTRRLCDELRQLGDVGSDPPRLVPSEQLCRRAPAGLLLEIDVSERQAAVILHDEADVRFLDGPRWREAVAGSGGGAC